MMNTWNKTVVLFFGILGTLNFVFASDYASYAGGFLRMGTTARSIAMGSGFTAELDQGFSAYHNPAGISFTENRNASVTNHSLQLDRNFYVASFEINLPPTAGLGLSLVSAGVSQIDGRTESGEHTGFLSTSEDAYFISFGQRLRPWISVGINIKYLESYLPTQNDAEKGKGMGFDLGMMVRPFPHLSLGFVLQNLNSYYDWHATKREEFPVIYRFGGTFQYKEIYFVGDIGVVTDYEDILGVPVRIGGEYNYNENYFLRAGFGNSRVSLGTGMKYILFNKKESFVDYAFVMEPALNLAHVFTVSIQF